MSTFGMMQHLNIHICQNAQEAIDKGHIYRDDVKPVEIDKVVVVQGGTVEGNSTVDLVLKDKEGNKYVVMVTGRLLKSIPCG